MSLFESYAVYQEIKNVLKIYPDFVQLIEFNEVYNARRYDYDPYNPNQKKKKTRSIDTEESEKNSLRRAKTNVIDLALSNPFDMFATFTFNGDEKNVKKYGYTVANREDIDEIKRKMAYWLNNQRIIHGKFDYLIVPEFHKDGKAIHFHCLLRGYKGKLVDSGKRENGRIIYNIASYKGGHSTAVKIDDIRKVSNYISKYLTKDMPKFKGKQRYWCSNGLKRPLKYPNPKLTENDRALFDKVYEGGGKEIFEMPGQLSDADILRICDYGKRREDDLWIAE